MKTCLRFGAMDKKRRSRFCQSLILKINVFLVLLLLQSGPVYSAGSSFIIDTTAATIHEIGQGGISTGIIRNETFHGPNKGTWSYSVASFNLNYTVATRVFSSGNKVSVRGAHALSVTVQGNFTIGTELDVSGREVNFTSHEKPLFWLGGFVRVNKSCCTLGAGPGGAFSYHGGGHGGRGGGFYQDRNTSRFFGWSYYDTSYLLGGSTGTVLFSSKSGSGGGAIELIAENGTLTVDAPIKADGFSSSNTSEDEHCAGGSSGGLIRLRANKVIIGSKGRLSAAGGNSGYSLNHSHYCGGGGGGGVIQVFSLTDNTKYVANSSICTRPGLGIQDGEEGLEQVAVYFDRDMDLMINTSSCKMTWASDYEYQGVKDDEGIFNVTTEEGQEIKEHFEVCKIEFTSSIFIGPKVRVKFSGHRALSLISTHGNIEINSPLNISGLDLSSVNSNVGGYVKTSGVKTSGPAKVSNCSSSDLYGYDFEALLGGSVCLFSDENHQVTVAGGGALELKARKGAIVIASTISADGYTSDTARAGAMGGTIRLDASKVILQRDGLLTARGWQAGGGVIQIKSDEDIEGICDSKFNVTGSTLGLVNILVSTANTFQVQYIQQGILNIDTTNARWIHKLSSNGSMVYSYYGEIETTQLTFPSIQYKVAKFEFQTPILINGSAEVKLSGLHSLSVSSEEGIYIGVDVVVGKPKVNEDKAVGGYCVRSSRAPEGLGPGRGQTGANAGAGHGGKGGLLFEDEGTIYGRTYGIQPDIKLIGGSTGTANCSSNYCTAKNSPELVVACGGGAIEIDSKKNLTINAAILVSGTTFSIFNQTSSGGSSGGTIILTSMKHVILGDNAKLQAQGADAVQNATDSSSRGGGGGGVIAIFYKGGLVGKPPTPDVDTRGGDGTTSGDNGLVVLNGTRKYGFPSPVIEEGKTSMGCVIMNSSLLSNLHGVVLKAHEAAPSKCVEECRGAKYHYALIQRQTCNCTNDNSTMQKVNESRCSVRCWSNSSLICGGEQALSAYRTGYIFSSSSSVASSSTPVVSAVFPSKTSVEVMASSSVLVSLTTEPTNESTNQSTNEATTEPTTETTTESTTETTTEPNTSSEESTTRSPTEPSVKFKEIANATITEENVVDVVQQLKNLTTAETLNGGDTKVALEILYKITFNDSFLPKNKSERQKLGQNILEVASSLLSKENVDNWGVPTKKDNNTGRVTSQVQVLELVENIGLKLGEQLDNNASLVIESKNIAMGVETRVPDETALGVEYPNYDELSPEWKGRDRVFVHKELFDKMATDKSSRTTVVYALYNQISELFPANTNDKESSKDMIVNSRILALKFNKQTNPPFKKPIKLWFDKLKTENVTKPPICSFVAFKNDGGTWSDAGCNLVDVKDPTVECACDHLTNFAILMQVKEFEVPEGHVKALTIITYVGCGISLFGLALTLATFLSLETLASERTSIHKNLVVAIGLAQIVFLAGIDAIYNPIACKAVALFLHYLYTAAFTWMLCEGIHLYSKVVEVFSEGSKMKYYYALGWGLPLTIVFVSACSRWGGYGNERACWISIQDGLIWAFVAPVLIIMVINFVVMIMVIKVIIASVTSLQNPGNTSQVRAGVKGMIVLLPLLGLTWVFGLMAINKDTIAFQYLFAILNSLQGLFIFAFHCIGNTEVRVAYKRLHEKRTLAKSLPEHSLSTSHHSSREKRRMDSNETHLTGDEDIIVTKTIRSVSDVRICGDNIAMQTVKYRHDKTKQN